MTYYYLGIDVGTGSARAGVFDAQGRLAGTAALSVVRVFGTKGCLN
jgi:ribulose kinase